MHSQSMLIRSRLGYTFLVVILLGCGAAASPRSTTSSSSVSASSDLPARLVVSVVLDQLGSWALDRYLPFLDEDGAIRTTVARGRYIKRGEIQYAATLTSPGHAAIYTGAPPSKTGVFANKRWNYERGKLEYLAAQGGHAILGASSRSISPDVLRLETVGDALHEARGRDAQVVSLSIKGYAAALSGGRTADLVLWYQYGLDDGGAGMTTSRYYREQLPPWLQAWNKAHPVRARMDVWTPQDPTAHAAVTAPPDTPGRWNWQGFGSSFPHDPKKAEVPEEVFSATPASSEYLLDAAWECVQQRRLGQDDIPDLLAISISGTDYVGHVFGVESLEYLDNLIRVDRALGAFLRQLEQTTSIAVLMTSDHGSIPFPELREKGTPGGRLARRDLVDHLDKVVDKALNAGDWFVAYEPPLLYLGPDALAGPEARVKEIALEELQRHPAVEAAFDVATQAKLEASQNELERLAGKSFPPDVSGAIFVVPANGYIHRHDPGTTHGTPWDYDRYVPILYRGPGITPSVHERPVGRARVAATLSAMLSIRNPAGTTEAPLPGVVSSAQDRRVAASR